MSKSSSTKSRDEQIKIAKQLCYGREVVEAIRNAKDDNEVYRIMINARKGTFKPKDKPE